MKKSAIKKQICNRIKKKFGRRIKSNSCKKSFASQKVILILRADERCKKKQTLVYLNNAGR